MRLMAETWKCFVLMVGVVVGCRSGASHIHWPEVCPSVVEMHMIDNKSLYKIYIYGNGEKPLYLLECCVNAWENDSDEFNFSGAFECRLVSLYSKERDSTLLANDENATADWQSSGRFLEEDMESATGGKRVWQTVRLRGMRLTIEICHVIIDEGLRADLIDRKAINSDDFPRIKEMDVKITVVRDKGAVSALDLSPEKRGRGW